MTLYRLKAEERNLSGGARIEFSKAGDNGKKFVVQEELAEYEARKKRKTSKRKT